MCSPLGPVMAGIIMVELKNTMAATLSNHLYIWRGHVYDTSTFVKEESSHIFHRTIEFFQPKFTIYL